MSEKELIVCDYCLEEFTITAEDINLYNFCSKECAIAFDNDMQGDRT